MGEDTAGRGSITYKATKRALCIYEIETNLVWWECRVYVSEWHGVRLENLIGITSWKSLYTLLYYIDYIGQWFPILGIWSLERGLWRVSHESISFPQSFFNQWILKVQLFLHGAFLNSSLKKVRNHRCRTLGALQRIFFFFN